MFWESFYDLCVKAGKSPNKVAKELNIPSGSITAWKRGSVPRPETLHRIAEYFNTSVESLIGDTGIVNRRTSLASAAGAAVGIAGAALLPGAAAIAAIDTAGAALLARKKPAKDDLGGLSMGEAELIQMFRLLPEDLQVGILAQIKAVLIQRGLLPGQS